MRDALFWKRGSGLPRGSFCRNLTGSGRTVDSVLASALFFQLFAVLCLTQALFRKWLCVLMIAFSVFGYFGSHKLVYIKKPAQKQLTKASLEYFSLNVINIFCLKI